MLFYKVSKSDLECFAEKIYEEGSPSFQEWKNSIGHKMIEDFISDKTSEEIFINKKIEKNKQLYLFDDMF